MIQFVSPDDEHDVLETCKKTIKNKYIERNLCVTLVIYQESLHDARSTKCKNVLRVNNKRQGDDKFTEVLPHRFDAHKICNRPISYSPKNYNKIVSL